MKADIHVQSVKHYTNSFKLLICGVCTSAVLADAFHIIFR